jgi:hypothetical protein
MITRQQIIDRHTEPRNSAEILFLYELLADLFGEGPLADG